MTMSRSGNLLVLVLTLGLIVAAPPADAQPVQTTTPATPTNMGPVINSASRDAEPTFTADGTTMYFNCMDRAGRTGNDICVSTRSDGEWSEPEIVEAVSTEGYTEVEPLLSPDGRQLYIMSDRPGGLGSFDIWVSDRVDGDWTEPIAGLR